MSERKNKFNHLSVDIINNLPGSFFVIDSDTRNLIRWNKNFEKITGYAAEELSRMTPLDFATPDEKKLTLKMIEKIIKTGKASGEQFLVTKSGKKIPHYFSHRRLKRGPKTYSVGMGLDITEQREAIETVKRERRVSDAIISGLPGTFFVIDLKTFKIVRWSSNFEKVGGYTKKEILNMSPEDVVVKKDRQKIREALKKVIKEGKANLEVCTLTKDGKKIPNYISAALFSEEGSQYIAGIGINISERKKAEKALVHSEEKFRNLFETTVQGIICIDSSGDVTSANSAAAEMLGISVKEILTKNIQDPWNVIREDGSKVTNDDFPITESLRTGKSVQNQVLGVFNYKEKKYRWLNVSASAIFKGKTKKPFHVYVTLEDITEQKKAEHALRDSEDKYRTMFDTMTQGVIYVSEKGRIISANSAAEKISGISFSEAKGKTIAELNIKAVHEDGSDFPVEARPLQVALRTGTQIKNKVMAVFNKIEKQFRWVNITAIPKFRPGEDKPFEVYCIAEDITEEKEAERKQAKLSAVIETTPDLAGLADENATAVYLNKAGRKMAGISKKEDITKYKIPDFHPKWAAEKVKKEGIPIAIKKGSWSGETAILDREGKITPVLQVILSHKNPDGSIAYFSTVAHDISERKKSEEKLRESEEKYRMFVNTSPDTVITTDMKAKITFASSRTLDYFGYKPEELLEMNSFDLIVPEEREKAIKAFQNTLKKGFVRNAEFTLLKKDGSKFIAEINAAIIKDVRGEPKTLISTMRDITERKEAEEALKTSENKFRQFFENEPAYAYMVSPKGLIIDINKAALKALGYDKKELVGRPIQTIYAPESIPKMKELFKVWEKTGKLENIELIIKTKKGEKRTVLLSADAVRDPKGKVIHSISIQKDITESKKAQEERETLVHDLGERYKEINGLFAISKIAEEPNISVDQILKKAVEVIPPAWQYPEITCARIVLNDKEFKTSNFKKTKWNQSADITVYDKKVGSLSACYLKEMPELYEGPFLKEERSLINAMAKELGRIIESKESEEALKRSEERFRVTFENAPIGMGLVSPEGRFIQVNTSWAKMLGYSVKELGRLDFQKITHPDDLGASSKALKALISGKINTWQAEKRYLHKNGQIIWILLNTTLVRDEQKKPLYFISEIQDITKRKKTEDALKQKDLDIRRAYVDVLSAVTGGKLILMSRDELENALGEPVTKALKTTSFEQLAQIRKQIRKNFNKKFPNLVEKDDMLLAAGETLTNSVKHAHGGSLRMYKKNQLMQILIEDKGPGIDFSQLPKATLLSGFSTAKSLGVGFDVMLEFSDRVLLFTEPGKTMIVLEKFAEEKEKQIAV